MKCPEKSATIKATMQAIRLQINIGTMPASVMEVNRLPRQMGRQEYALALRLLYIHEWTSIAEMQETIALEKRPNCHAN